MFSTMDISASALVAQRVRLDVIANNLANVSTTHNEKGEKIPFRRKDVIFQAGVPERGSPFRGVSIPRVYEDPSAFRKAYEPENPDAIADGRDHDGDGKPDDGYVFYPNVNPLVEMVNMIDATRAYEANVTAFEATKGINAAALRLLA
jgi:flagellar basal-body rod protein FlgC